MENPKTFSDLDTRQPGVQIRDTALVEEGSPTTTSFDRQRTTLRRVAASEKKVLLPILASNAVIICFCATVLVYGNNGRVVLETGSLSQTLTSWCVGLAVQAAIVPIINLGRLFCQLWFARQLATKGMRGRQMMSAWSALYSGSFRGLEDMFTGMSPIAAVLLILYVGEVTVLGAIGTLYSMSPVERVRESGFAYLMAPVTASWVGYNSDFATGRLTLDLLSLISPLGKNSVIPPTSFQPKPADAHCDDDANVRHCSVSRIAISHPFHKGIFDVEKSSFYNASKPPVILANEAVQSHFTSYTTNITCSPASAHYLEYAFNDGGVDYYQVFETSTGFPDGLDRGSFYIAGPQKVAGPELGLVLMHKWNADRTKLFTYNTEAGELVVLIIGRKVSAGETKSFARLKETATNFELDVATCKISVFQGQAYTHLRLPFVEPETLADLSTVTRASADTNIIATNSVAAYLLSYPVTNLNCYAQLCTNPEVMPWFDLDLGLMPTIPASDRELDDRFPIMVGALADLILATTVGISVPSSVASEFDILSTRMFSALQISTACSGVLIFGICSATLLIIVHHVSAFTFNQNPRLRLGVKMTDSIYDFLCSIGSTVTHSADDKIALDAQIAEDVRENMRMKEIHLKGQQTGVENNAI